MIHEHSRSRPQHGKVARQPRAFEADKDAEYAAVIEIDLAEVTEPVVCAPNDPDDARLLSQVAGDEVNEVLSVAV